MTTSQAPSGAKIIVGSREQLLHLLAEASEIEHCLMCSYLYAAFSLRDGDDGLDPAAARLVGSWRKAIMDVAIEEMGHLLMVANLTVAVGGRPHLARPNFPVAPGYFPSGVVVRLNGFGPDTLDHFIFLERPRGEEEEDGAGFEVDDYERRQARPGLMPSAQDYDTIGDLYDAIRANIVACHRDLGAEDFFVSDPSAQLGPEIVDLPGVMVIRTLEDAMATLDLIVEQGEGSRREAETSHYRRFLAIREEYQAQLAKNPAFEPAWPVADNPVLRRPPDGEDKAFIHDPDAAQLLDLACASYGLLLRVLGQGFARSERDEPLRKKLMDLAFALMHLMGAAAKALARKPAGSDTPNVNAGMSFTMLRGVEPLLHGRSEVIVINSQVQALAASAERLLGRPPALLLEHRLA
ncbi:MAG: ferritin-like protein [Caulobacter sp.]